MAFDKRDCRADVIIGDDNVPDDISLPADERDITCAWVDFTDSQYNPRLNLFGSNDPQKAFIPADTDSKPTIIVSKKTEESI